MLFANLKFGTAIATKPVLTGPAIASCSWDGYAAAVVVEAGAKALTTGQKQPISMMDRPVFYVAIKGVAA